MLYTEIVKPEGTQITLTLEHSPKNAQNQKGAVSSLVFTGGQTAGTEEYTYAGTLSLQPEAGSDAFTVDAAEGDVVARVYGFNLMYAPSAEVVDQVAGSSTRDVEFLLRLTPQGEPAQGAQVIRAKATLQSRLNSRSATYFTGTLTWLDEGSQAQIKADFSGNSAPPWAMAAIDPNGAIRVDTMTAAQLKTLGLQVRTTLEKGLTAALARLLTPATTAP